MPFKGVTHVSKNQYHSRTQNKVKQKKKKQRITLAILVPIFAIILAGAIYIAQLFATVENEIDASFVEIERPEPVKKVDPIEEPVSFLILGVDNDVTRPLESTRADSIIYATLNPLTHEMNMVSIPRDTYVPIIKNGQVIRQDRINAAYAIGEESAMVETVENWLDLGPDAHINYYATFNFSAFLNIIDELGGIEMDVPVTIREMDSNDKTGSIYLEEGYQTLDGEQALALARTRKIDDDVARGHRQQLIIQAIIKKALNFQSVTKYTSIAETVGSNMKTNMRLSDMTAIAQTGLNQNFEIKSHVFEWTSFIERGMDLVRIEPNSFVTIQKELQDSLVRTERTTLTIEEGDDASTSNSSKEDNVSDQSYYE